MPGAGAANGSQVRIIWRSSPRRQRVSSSEFGKMCVKGDVKMSLWHELANQIRPVPSSIS
jgi:hypothetical protein